MTLSFFGQEVRIAREGHGWSQAELGERIHYRQPHVSRIEGGAQFPTPEFARACDTAFGTFGIYERLREHLSEQSHPDWFRDYVQLERSAVSICDYSPTLIMGMLQTPEYAEAVFRASHPGETAGQIRERVEARARRREALDKDGRPLLWVILHEAAIRTVVGSRALMADQLRALLAAVEEPNTVIQVLPNSADGPWPPAPFTILRQKDQSAIVYSEMAFRGQLDHSAAVLDRAQTTYDRLRASALSERDTRTLIRQILEEYRHGQS